MLQVFLRAAQYEPVGVLPLDQVQAVVLTTIDWQPRFWELMVPALLASRTLLPWCNALFSRANTGVESSRSDVSREVELVLSTLEEDTTADLHEVLRALGWLCKCAATPAAVHAQLTADARFLALFQLACARADFSADKALLLALFQTTGVPPELDVPQDTTLALELGASFSSGLFDSDEIPSAYLAKAWALAFREGENVPVGAALWTTLMVRSERTASVFTPDLIALLKRRGPSAEVLEVVARCLTEGGAFNEKLFVKVLEVVHGQVDAVWSFDFETVLLGLLDSAALRLQETPSVTVMFHVFQVCVALFSKQYGLLARVSPRSCALLATFLCEEESASLLRRRLVSCGGLCPQCVFARHLTSCTQFPSSLTSQANLGWSSIWPSCAP
jgi:hypothetical protein